MKKKCLLFVFILIGLFICPKVYADEITADERWTKIFDVYEKNIDMEEESYTFELTKNTDLNIYDVKTVYNEDDTVSYVTQIKRVDNYAIVEFKDNLSEQEYSMIFTTLMNLEVLFLRVDDYDNDTIGNIILGTEKTKSGLEESDEKYTYSYKDESAEIRFTYPSFIKYDLENGIVLEEKNKQEENDTEVKPEVPDNDKNHNQPSEEENGKIEKPKEEGTVVKVPDTLSTTSKISKVLGLSCFLIGISILVIYMVKSRKQITQQRNVN